MIYIPQGKLALTPAEERQQLREALLGGQTIAVAPNGQITNNRNPISANSISIPQGKLACK